MKCARTECRCDVKAEEGREDGTGYCSVHCAEAADATAGAACRCGHDVCDPDTRSHELY